MMRRLNAEGHDETQYLPRGTPPVNPFRERQGGVKWEGTGVKALTWMPDIMNDTLDEEGRELLTRDQLHTCESFFRAVVATGNELKIDRLKIYMGDSVEDEKKAKDIFYAIMTRLLPYQSNLMLWVVCDDRNRGNIALAKHLKSSIQNAVDCAQKVISAL